MEPLTKTNQELVPYDSLNADEKAKVETIKKSVGINDTQALLQFGVGAQTKIADFSDTILSEIRNKDAGYVGDALGGLLTTIKDINVGSLSARSPLASIPIIGNLVDAARKFVQRYEKLSVQIEKITNELDKSRNQLMRDITLLDSLFEKNYDYLKELDLYIIAGEQLLAELDKTVIPGFKTKAEKSQDPLDAQKLQDMQQFLSRFEKKLHDLKLSRMVSIQTAPQIRLIQNNNQLLVEKIQTSILNTIPLWKNQVIIAITLFRQKKSLSLQKEVSDTTNELLKKNSEMLKGSSIEIARESERGIVDIETLQKVNTDLISTIEETLRIQQDGRQKRAQAEEQLKKMESELKQKLLEVKGS